MTTIPRITITRKHGGWVIACQQQPPRGAPHWERWSPSQDGATRVAKEHGRDCKEHR